VKLDIALCLPPDSQTLTWVRAITADALSRLGVTDSCIDDVRLALSEACTNVIQHADATDAYEIRLGVDGTHCEMRVVDFGGGFDSESAAATLPDQSSPGGRGISLMRALVDEITFESGPGFGTIVRLVKELEVRPDSVLAQL
jgi:serine/threonine-protein kinase RsbW